MSMDEIKSQPKMEDYLEKKWKFIFSAYMGVNELTIRICCTFFLI